MNPSPSRVLITGGGTGIGAGIARALHQRGHSLILTGRRPEPLRALAQELDAEVVPADLLTEVSADPSSFFQRTGPVDHLVHNAGAYLHSPLGAWTPQLWAEQYALHVIAPALLSQAFAEQARGPGCLVFISSTLAERPAPGTAAYAASKAGMLSLARSLAQELAPRQIRSVALLPGVVPTAMTQSPRGGDDPQARLQALTQIHPLGRLGSPEDIGAAVAFLLEATWITGVALPVDGGLLSV